MINILYLHAGAEMYGADKVLLELVRGLDKERFCPIVVLPCEGVLVDAMRQDGIHTEVMEYPILRRKYFNLKGIIHYGISYFQYSRKLYNYVKNKNISIIHVNTTAVLEGIYLKIRLKVPTVWHIHEILVKPRIIYRFTSYVVGKFSDLVIVVSKAVGRHLLSSGKVKRENIKVVYNGVDNQVFHEKNKCQYLRKEWNIPENAIIVGMIGRVNAWKGQEDFIKAVEPILSRHQNVYAIMVGGVFAGEEWRLERLKDIVKQSPNKDRFVLKDFRKDTPNIHSLFDIFVLPSINPDPLPTVVLEAMATGKPIVGYRHGGICEMVEESSNGLLAEVNNPEDLSDKIEYLVEHLEHAQEMGKNSADRQKNLFSIESYINKFEKLYANLASENEEE